MFPAANHYPRRTPFVGVAVFIALSSCCLLWSLGCRGTAQAEASSPYQDPHRYALEGELRDTSAEEASLAAAILSKTRESQETDAHIGSDRQALVLLQTQVHSYMQQHSLAVAAILAGAATTRTYMDRETSDDAREISVGVGIIVLLWAATHEDELAAVVQTLNTADERRTALQHDLAQAQAEYTAELGQVEELKLREDKSREKITMLRTALSTSSSGGSQ